jgi:nicotinic acid mononucleotide adenylyltransferase
MAVLGVFGGVWFRRNGVKFERWYGVDLLFLQLQFSVIDKNGKKILFRKGELQDWLNSSKHEQDENIHQAASRYV